MTAELGGGHTLEMRAEIGLLSRNVKVIGSRDMQWSDEIEACPDGFDTGKSLIIHFNHCEMNQITI